MISVKVKIDRNEGVRPYCIQGSHAFRMMYKAEGKCDMKETQKRILSKNSLLDISVLCCIETQVKMKKAQHDASNRIKQETIKEYTKQIEELDDKTKIFKIDRKRNRLIGSLENEEVFGGRYNLRKYTYNLNEINRTG